MIQLNKWSECFESADTRKRQRLGWFLSPSGCDSRGFRMLMRSGKDGLAAFGFFQALCQSMATQSIATRQSGIFQNSDGTLMEFADILELSRLGGMSPADYRQIAGRLVACGWISLHKSLDLEQNASCLPVVCQSSPGFVQGEGEGKEEGQEQEQGQRGTKSEPNGNHMVLEVDEIDPMITQSRRIKRPTREQAIAYGKTLGMEPHVSGYWWDVRERAEWIKNASGGSRSPIGPNWQADLSACRAWATEEGNKIKATTPPPVRRFIEED